MDAWSLTGGTQRGLCLCHSNTILVFGFQIYYLHLNLPCVTITSKNKSIMTINIDLLIWVHPNLKMYLPTSDGDNSDKWEHLPSHLFKIINFTPHVIFFFFFSHLCPFNFLKSLKLSQIWNPYNIYSYKL